MSAAGPGASDDKSGRPVDPTPGESAWQRQRRLAAVYGEVLPESTSDDRDDPTGESGSEEWLRAQVPPHHG